MMRTSRSEDCSKPTAPAPTERTFCNFPDADACSCRARRSAPPRVPLRRFLAAAEVSKISSGFNCPESALSCNWAIRPCVVATETQPAFNVAPAEMSAAQLGSKTSHLINSPFRNQCVVIGADRSAVSEVAPAASASARPPGVSKQLVIWRPWLWSTTTSHCSWRSPQAMAASSKARPLSASQPATAAKCAASSSDAFALRRNVLWLSLPRSDRATSGPAVARLATSPRSAW
mmetsp:Transcript_100872/g.291722  ORF Transcript_100872/g.291722 Transcript_100872/m.291722 type:complete len:232 (+) Transcript_100872:289-984(+)